MPAAVLAAVLAAVPAAVAAAVATEGRGAGAASGSPMDTTGGAGGMQAPGRLSVLPPTILEPSTLPVRVALRVTIELRVASTAGTRRRPAGVAG